ncbi:MAG: hypothetical protein ACYS1C_07400, partial [Planctomycetota bacterium]
MPAEPDETNHSRDDAAPEADDLWDGVPLELESGPGGLQPRSRPIGEETAERPLADLLPPEESPAPARWLARWLLLTGVVAAALALASIAALLLRGVRPAAWRGALLALDGAVIVLVARSFLVAGSSARRVCHRLFGAAGLTAAILLVLGALVQSTRRFLYGEPLSGLLSDLFVFGLLGLAGCTVSLQCLRRRGWACRTAALSALAFLALLALQPFTGYRLFPAAAAWASHPALPGWHWLLALGACGAGITVAQGGLARPRGRRGPWKVLMGVWVVLLVAATALLSLRLGKEFGADGASVRLWRGALCWELAALGPPLLAGLLLAWRSRGPLPLDVGRSSHFAWSLVALGGLAFLALWVPFHLKSGPLELLLVPGGILAAMGGAWYAERHGGWMSSWAVAPTVGFAVAALGSLEELLAFARTAGSPRGGLWGLGVAYLWCPLSVGLLL